MKVRQILLAIFTFSFVFFVACNNNEEPMEMFTDRFDRKAMLQDWSDLIIIPAFESYVSSVSLLLTQTNVFLEDTSDKNFDLVREAYLNASLSWQHVSMFDIGKAEEIGLRNYTNIFPTDVTAIEENINSQDYNLELPSNFDTQGFPALDYLLYGIGDTQQEIVTLLSDDNYSRYLHDIVMRLYTLSELVLNDWKSGYRDTFINNDGSSATASVDKLVNDFLFYYEKYLRAGKIGIPAGIFSGNPIPTSVEAPYSNIYSKQLFEEAFKATQNFFQGKSHDGSSQGQGLLSYLQFIRDQNQGVNIADLILQQWESAESQVSNLQDSFQDQIIEDNSKILQAYDELQKAVVILKVDMMQVLNIQVDYVDADGD